MFVPATSREPHQVAHSRYPLSRTPSAVEITCVAVRILVSRNVAKGGNKCVSRPTVDRSVRQEQGKEYAQIENGKHEQTPRSSPIQISASAHLQRQHNHRSPKQGRGRAIY